MGWDKVEAELPNAKAVAFDGCHKIYLTMDDNEVAKARVAGYDESDDSLFPLDETVDFATRLLLVKTMWDRSCSLRYITATRTDPDPAVTETVFDSLIEQCEEV